MTVKFDAFVDPSLPHGQARVDGRRVFFHCEACARQLLDQFNRGQAPKDRAVLVPDRRKANGRS